MAYKKRLKFTTETFIDEVKKRIGEKALTLDFSKVVFDGSSKGKRVKMRCTIHGPFEPEARTLLDKRGCPKCRNRLSQSQFLKNVIEKHGEKYDLTNIEYNGINEIVKVGCPIHGEFETVAYYLSQGRGCQKCVGLAGLNHYSEEQISKLGLSEIACILYSIKLIDKTNNQTIYKIGITTKGIEYRFESLKRTHTIEIIDFKESSLSECKLLEIKLLKDNLEYKLIPENKFSGFTECFVKPIELRSV